LVIGEGGIGVATGLVILENNLRRKVVIADKENTFAQHAFVRNSGVLHAGFYYSPDPLKAKFCRNRNSAICTLAKKHGIPVRSVGKVVVARNHEANYRLCVLQLFFKFTEENDGDVT
jgi:L-2-hydroxyglutarate oxidase LhgO